MSCPIGFDSGAKYGFFRPEQQGDEPGRGNANRSVAQRDTEGWAKIICRLIASGHLYSEIADYTLAQIKIFAKYATVLEREKRAAVLADLAIASQGDNKAIEKSISRLMSS